MSESNKELVRRLFEQVFNNQNLSICEDLMAADFIERAAAPFSSDIPGKVNGPQAMRGTVQWLLTQFPDLHFSIEELISEGDMIAVRVLGEGTNLGPIGPIPPTGRRFESRSSHWYRVQNGKLAEHWATRDDLLAFMQLGIIRSPEKLPG